MKRLCYLPFMLVLTLGCSLNPPDATNGKGGHAHPVPAFSLTERSGQTVTNESLKGKVWVASFVFTRCSGPCPSVTGTMAKLQKSLADVENFRLVTFTVDPERDDPQELANYAKNFSADPVRWLFLTGPEKEVRTLLNEGFKIEANRNPTATEVGKEFDHSTRLVLVDQNGNIRGYFDGKPPEDQQLMPRFQENLDRLAKEVRALVKTGP